MEFTAIPYLNRKLSMSRKYKFCDNEELYFVSFSVVGWIDLFVRNEYKDIFIESLRYCQQYKDLELYAWCIMTSHVHLIIGSRGKLMSDIMRDMKRHTSEKLRKSITDHHGESRKEWMIEYMTATGKCNVHNRGFQLWQQDNHPVELSTEKIMHQKLNYLHENPVASGFVEKPEDWIYSSAKDYYKNEKGMLDIVHIESLLITI